MSSAPVSSQLPGTEHKTLREYLADVQQAIKRALPESVWVVAELSSYKTNAKGTVFLDLLESENGQEVAKARGVMYSAVAKKMVEHWTSVTGGIPQAGMRVLVKVRGELTPQYGFSLMVTGIDPSYTLGDMQAKLQEIISSLKSKGWYDLQRSLPTPSGYWNVAVVSPREAAGLADFSRDAEQLSAAGVCRFEYFAATFQGREASESIRSALKAVYDRHQIEPFDAVCVIRGGGAKADLAWLNDMNVSAWICRLPIPVFTGIGHEVDECVLDLVAHRKFDTPSKVVGFIKTQLLAEASGLKTQGEKICSMIQRLASAQSPWLERSSGLFTQLTRHLVHEQVKSCLVTGNEFIRLTTLMLNNERQKLQKAPESLLRHSERLCASERSKTQLSASKFATGSLRMVERAREKLERETELYDRTNPLALLGRGFALVRGPAGELLINAEQARAAGTLSLRFSDGTVVAKVDSTN